MGGEGLIVVRERREAYVAVAQIVLRPHGICTPTHTSARRSVKPVMVNVRACVCGLFLFFLCVDA